MALQFARLGWTDLAFLQVGGRPIAFSYGFHNEQDYFFYATAFDADPRYGAYSPGVLLVKHLLERGFDRGFRRFDFMGGDEPYKRTWATHQDAIDTYVMGKATARSRMALSLYRAHLFARQRLRRASRIRALVRKLVPLPGR
jgi:CelD/BcsL family acetyltransferase involved in cellulose biosynthesis